jgi:hypothetical protein
MQKMRIIIALSAAGVATILTALAAAGSIAAAASAQANDGHVWKTYVNDRFRYSICYPQDLLVPQGEAANSDGQRFLSNKDNGELAVYGTNNALDETLRQRLSNMASRLTGSSGKVTYKVQKANWFVLSGESGETTFYAKTLLNRDQFKTFELTYDRAAAALYDPLAARFAACFADLARK